MSKVQSKLNLEQVGRVCVTVADTDRAIDFYVNTLGFEKIVDVPMGDAGRWVEVALPGAADDDRARAAAAGNRGRRQPDRHLPRHVGRRRGSRRAEGGRGRRRRRGRAVGRARAADVLAARPGRELADHRPALVVVALFTARPAGARPVALRLAQRLGEPAPRLLDDHRVGVQVVRRARSSPATAPSRDRAPRSRRRSRAARGRSVVSPRRGRPTRPSRRRPDRRRRAQPQSSTPVIRPSSTSRFRASRSPWIHTGGPSHSGAASATSHAAVTASASIESAERGDSRARRVVARAERPAAASPAADRPSDRCAAALRGARRGRPPRAAGRARALAASSPSSQS